MSTKSKGFDLGARSVRAACERGFEYEIEHPDGPTGVFITVVGRESDTFRDAMRKVADKRTDGEFDKLRRKKKNSEQAEEIEATAIEILAACTKGWRTMTVEPSEGKEAEYEPTVTHNGKALEFSDSNARFLYREEPWIRSQIDVAIGTVGNFFKD